MNIFNLTVQYLEKCSGIVHQPHTGVDLSACYIPAAFTLASGYPGLEIMIRYYCTVKYTRAQPL